MMTIEKDSIIGIMIIILIFLGTLGALYQKGHTDGFNACEQSLRDAGALESDVQLFSWDDRGDYLRAKFGRDYYWFENDPIHITADPDWRPEVHE